MTVSMKNSSTETNYTWSLLQVFITDSCHLCELSNTTPTPPPFRFFTNFIPLAFKKTNHQGCFGMQKNLANSIQTQQLREFINFNWIRSKQSPINCLFRTTQGRLISVHVLLIPIDGWWQKSRKQAFYHQSLSSVLEYPLSTRIHTFL